MNVGNNVGHDHSGRLDNRALMNNEVRKLTPLIFLGRRTDRLLPANYLLRKLTRAPKVCLER